MVVMEKEQVKKLKQIIEAALFMSSEPLLVQDLARIVKAGVEETRIALNQLSLDLEERHSALEVRDDSVGFRLAVRKEFEEFTQNFSAIPELNKSVLKTLAFISYKQPIRQSEVIRYRNNKAYEHIKALEEKGFIRRETVGRTFLVFTTKKFIEYFGEPKNPVALEKKAAEQKPAL